MTGDITVEIVEHIGNIGDRHENGWTRELNRVAWNGADAKFDIREWSQDHSRMTRGITLNDAEMKAVIDLLAGRF